MGLIKHLRTYITIGFFLIFSQLAAQVDYVIQEIDGVSYYIHVVEKGHTLYAISKIYKVDVETITEHNKEAENGLNIGQTLRIPVGEKPQNDKWENPIRIDGSYLIHRVKKGETLFAISKEYKVDINDILEKNPDANIGLKRGMELKIPMNDVDTTNLVEIEPAYEDSLLSHKVNKGETLYSISKLYEVKIEDVLALNGGLPDGLKTGQFIRIPKANELFIAQTRPIEYTLPVLDSIIIKDEYNIALMLPFYLDYIDSLEIPKKQNTLQNVSYQFYAGARLALDTLEQIGLNANVFVYDVISERASIDEVLTKNELENMQLVVGPLQRKAISEVSSFCRKQGVHVVCPVPQSNKILLNNPNLSKVHTSPYTQQKILARELAKVHQNDHVILVNSLDVRDTRLVDSFRAAYNKEVATFPTSSHSEIKELRASVKSVGDIKAQLSLVKTNVLIVPSKDKVVIQDLLTKAALTEEDYHIVVYGLEDWLNFDFIDSQYKSKFELGVPSVSFIDYNSPECIAFVNKFREKNGVEPDEYAFLAYDIMLYYGKGLIQFGIDFPNQFQNMNQEGLLHMSFDYYKTGMESGYENRSLYLLKHKDYKLVGRACGLPQN